MDWSRFAGAAVDALLIAFALGAVLAPPDPFTQLLFVGPAFAAALWAVYRYGRRTVEPWWKRYLAFVAGVYAGALAWRLLDLAVGPIATAGLRPAVLLVGVAVGAWLACYGGLERLRGEAGEA